ncbi:MAG: EAL domain-containing protein [Steroidobacteraceae bacterium]
MRSRRGSPPMRCARAATTCSSTAFSFCSPAQLPVDYLKIDGEFVRGMSDDPVPRAMVKAIHALGKAMGIATIAECVESAGVRRQLEELGVDYVQGLEVGAPLPLSRYLLQFSGDAVGRARHLAGRERSGTAERGMRVAREAPEVGGLFDEYQHQCVGGGTTHARGRSQGQSPRLRRHAHHRSRRLGRSA